MRPRGARGARDRRGRYGPWPCSQRTVGPRCGLCPPRRRRRDLPTLAAAIRPRASQHLRTSWGLTLWRLFRHDRISSSRTCEVQIPRGRARCAQGSCEVGILNSGVSELRAVGLQLGNRSLPSIHGQAGAQHSLSPGGCRRRTGDVPDVI
jgi:hypothetical protein